MQGGHAGTDVDAGQGVRPVPPQRSMVASTGSTISGAARVLTLTGPMGQSEFSMSMTCLARTPCGVLVSIRTPASPALAGGAGAGAQLSRGRRRALSRWPVPPRSGAARRALRVCAGPGNVQHNLELEQVTRRWRPGWRAHRRARAIGRARMAQAWNASSVSHWVTTK